MSSGRPKKENPAVKNTKVDDELNGWLVMLQDMARAEGEKPPTHNEILKQAMLTAHPGIRQMMAQYEKQEAKKYNNLRKMKQGNGDTPAPDEE